MFSQSPTKYAPVGTRAIELASSLRTSAQAKGKLSAAAQFGHMIAHIKQASKAIRPETKRRHLGHAMVAFAQAKLNLAEA